MKNKIALLSVSFCFFLMNCEIEKEIEYPIRYQEKKLFITGFIGPINTLEMEVGQVVPPLENDYDPLREVRAELFRNNVSMGGIQNADDNFLYHNTGYQAIAGDTFHIEVSAEGIESARSNFQVIPRSVKLDSVSHFISMDNEIKVFIYFTDPPDNNYYSLLIKKYHTSGSISGFDQYIDLSNAFSDKEFNGTSHSGYFGAY